jgi:hypothetical protein
MKKNVKSKGNILPQNETVDSGFNVSELINDILDHLGIVIIAEAGHGKSFTAFTIAKEAMKNPNITVIIFSPSTIWRRNFGSINCVRVGTPSFNPIVENEKATLEPVPILRDTIFINLDKHWNYARSEWLEKLLQSKRHILFEIKYRNGRRIKAFESVVLQYIYEMQEHRLDVLGDYKQHYLVVFEELQNSFGTYSMNTDDSLDLLTIFTQSRSDANIHYIGIGQRLNDISTKIVERLRPFIGLTLGERSLAKVKAMMPEELRTRIQQLPKRHWIYLNGKENPEIVIPEYKREGKTTYLKPDSEETAKPKPEKRKPILRQVLNGLGKALMSILEFPKIQEPKGTPTPTQEQEMNETERDNQELDEEQEFLDKDMW